MSHSLWNWWLTSTFISTLFQIIQIVSAADRDLSPAGQQFSFRVSPEAAIKPNFTVRDFRSKFNHIQIYLLSCNCVKEHTNLETDAFLQSAQVHKIRKSIYGKSEVLYLAVNWIFNLYRLYLMRQIFSTYNMGGPLMHHACNNLSGKLNAFHVLNISFVPHAHYLYIQIGNFLVTFIWITHGIVRVKNTGFVIRTTVFQSPPLLPKQQILNL